MRVQDAKTFLMGRRMSMQGVVSMGLETSKKLPNFIVDSLVCDVGKTTRNCQKRALYYRDDRALIERLKTFEQHPHSPN